MLATAVVVAASGQASAADLPPVDVVSSVESAPEASGLLPEARVAAGGPMVAMPDTAVGVVEVNTPSGVIEMGIPGDAPIAPVRSGTVVYGDAATSSSVAVQPVADGVRALITIPRADQPQTYDFDLGGDVAPVDADVFKIALKWRS